MSDEDRSRWTDERLDDNVGIIHDELRALRELPNAMATLAVRIDQVGKDVDNCYVNVRDVAQRLSRYIEDEHKRRETEAEKEELLKEQRRQERKSDRRWLVATGLSSAGLVVAAIGLITGAF